MARNPAPTASSAGIPAPAPALCLDYVNTRYWRGSPEQTETLNSFADLIDWVAKSGAHDPATLARLRTGWPEGQAHEPVFAQALQAREAMHGVLDAVAGGTAPTSQSLAAFEKILAAAPPRHRLTQNGSKLEWRLERTEPNLPTLLAPLLWSAADLLIKPDGRLRRCANPKCLWLFHDTSKGGTRRWCFMSSCGNRAKAQRHYHGKKRR